jgi:hypothetical protein
VSEFGGHHRIEAGGLRGGGKRPRIAPMPHRHHRKNAHLAPRRDRRGTAFPLSAGENSFSATPKSLLSDRKHVAIQCLEYQLSNSAGSGNLMPKTGVGSGLAAEFGGAPETCFTHMARPSL